MNGQNSGHTLKVVDGAAILLPPCVEHFTNVLPYYVGYSTMKYDKAFLDESRLAGDAPADQLVTSLLEGHRSSELHPWLAMTKEQVASAPQASDVSTFLLSQKATPGWYDENRVLRGQQVFELYAAEMMMLLGAMSLPFCYAASPGNKALHLSDKMRQSPGKRLLDTAQFIISVSSRRAFGENNGGHFSIAKTRLIHAIARYYVQKGKWDNRWGLPINQEDMAGTNLAFSVIILMGLQQMGFVLTDRQKEDFIFLWRYVGYQLGIDEDLLPATFRESFGLMQIIRQRNFKHSSEGVELTQELLNYYRSMIPSNQAVFIEAQIRYFLGDEVSSFVGLSPDPVKDKINRTISTVKEIQNFFKLHKSSYQTMLANHEQLRKNLLK